METLTSGVVPPPPQDWLDNCVFKPRQHPVTRIPAAPMLTQEFENKLPPDVQTARERVIFPVIDRALESLTKPLPPAQIIRTVPDFPTNVSDARIEKPPPAKKTRRLSDPMVAELRSFRQLSSPLFCPESSLDTLPEYILFGLIALLAVAWPILAMLGVMSRS